MSTLAVRNLKSVAHIARFFHYRWGPPALDVLVSARGAKLVTVATRVATERKSVRRAIRCLIEMGLVRRNTGHGHPMRPEYLPTRAGEHVAAAWSGLDLALRRAGAEEAAQSKWPVPVLVLISAGIERFGEMLDACEELSPRALALALRALTRQSLAVRSLRDGFPPWVSYKVHPEATELQPELAGLLRAFTRHVRE